MKETEEYEITVVRATVQHAEPAQMLAVAHDSDFLQACRARSLALSRHIN